MSGIGRNCQTIWPNTSNHFQYHKNYTQNTRYDEFSPCTLIDTLLSFDIAVTMPWKKKRKMQIKSWKKILYAVKRFVHRPIDRRKLSWKMYMVGCYMEWRIKLQFYTTQNSHSRTRFFENFIIDWLKWNENCRRASISRNFDFYAVEECSTKSLKIQCSVDKWQVKLLALKEKLLENFMNVKFFFWLSRNTMSKPTRSAKMFGCSSCMDWDLKSLMKRSWDICFAVLNKIDRLK